jgi:hypothetical protein
MKYLAWALLALVILVVIVWQLAFWLVGLAIGLFKVFFVVWSIFVFWAGYKLKGWIDERRLQKTFKMS